MLDASKTSEQVKWIEQPANNNNKTNGKEITKMTIVKYFILTVIMISMLIGGIGQMITLNQTAAIYNAYFQMTFGFILFIWLSHKLIQRYEIKTVKPITNARDKK